MENPYLELKMYSLVLYQLKGIHQGIQTQHVVTAYGQAHPENLEYKQWANKDQTTIIKSAGGSQELTEAIKLLLEKEVTNVVFREPDLYGMPTAVCFLVDERVWDYKKYPEPAVATQEEWDDYVNKIGGSKNLFLRSFLLNYRLA